MSAIVLYVNHVLQWSEKDFLGYMATWESSVEERPGYTKTEKSRMLLSPATRLGIRMTCTYEYIINICLTMYMYIATLYKYFYITQANPSLKWFVTCSLSQTLNLSSAREFVRIPWNDFSGANGNVVEFTIIQTVPSS